MFVNNNRSREVRWSDLEEGSERFERVRIESISLDASKEFWFWTQKHGVDKKRGEWRLLRRRISNNDSRREANGNKRVKEKRGVRGKARMGGAIGHCALCSRVLSTGCVHKELWPSNLERGRKRQRKCRAIFD